MQTSLSRAVESAGSAREISEWMAIARFAFRKLTSFSKFFCTYCNSRLKTVWQTVRQPKLTFNFNSPISFEQLKTCLAVRVRTFFAFLYHHPRSSIQHISSFCCQQQERKRCVADGLHHGGRLMVMPAMLSFDLRGSDPVRLDWLACKGTTQHVGTLFFDVFPASVPRAFQSQSCED